MIKVAHIITRLDLGGAQQNTLYTVQHLDPARFEAVLIAGSGGILDEEAKKLNIPVYFVPDLARSIGFFKELKALWHIFRILWRERPQVAHTHSSKAGILGRWAAFFACIPMRLHTFHGFGFHDRSTARSGARSLPNGLSRRHFLAAWLSQKWLSQAGEHHDRQNPVLKRFFVALERLTSWISARLIFVSRANEEYARKHGIGNPSQYTLIRSGIPLRNYPMTVENPQKKKAEIGIGMHKMLVSSVGNLKPQKNPEDFLLFSKMVYEKLPETRFLFVGEGPLRTRLEAQMVREELFGKLIWAGWRRDVPEILAVSDVFVLTSLWEGLPRSLLEAMKSRLPCVCYDTDGVRDVIRHGENGYLVSCGDVERLAQYVLELLGDAGLRKRIGERAAESIGEEFDIDHMVRQQEDLYENLVRKVSVQCST